MRVSLAVFNSAGERVRQIYLGPAQAGTTQIELQPGLQPDPAGRLAYVIDGILTGAGTPQYWAMDNDSGQSVGGGLYYVTLSLTDPYGSTRSQSLAVQVLPRSEAASLEIYNSAGELVRNLSVDGLGGVPTDLLVGDGTAFSAEPGNPQSGLRLELKVGSGTQSLFWDGKTESGALAASGAYVVKLSYGEPGRRNVVETVTVVLLQSPALAAQAAAATARFGPNPVPAGQRWARLSYTPVLGTTGRVRLYNLAGELIAVGVDEGASGVIELRLQVSGGIYVADFGIDGAGGGRLARRALKLAVVQ